MNTGTPARSTVFDPSILFISEEDWLNPQKRDLFLEHLLAHLEHITEHHITQIYWTDELEELLWTHPQLPPWRLDRDWQLKIVPILYDLFAKCRIILEDLALESPCTIQPPLKTRYDVSEIHDRPKGFLYVFEIHAFSSGRRRKCLFLCGDRQSIIRR